MKDSSEDKGNKLKEGLSIEISSATQSIPDAKSPLKLTSMQHSSGIRPKEVHSGLTSVRNKIEGNKTDYPGFGTGNINSKSLAVIKTEDKSVLPCLTNNSNLNRLNVLGCW